MSSLFNAMGGMPQNNMMAEFNRFRQNFQGDPRQQVQSLLNSGQMTQQQFNQLSRAAQQFMQMMPR